MIKQLSLAFAAVLLLASGPGEGASPCANPAYVQAWTPWFDRDDPSGTGDWETLSILEDQYPGKICDFPQDVEALTLSGQTVTQAGESIYINDKTSGFACRNKDQPDGTCYDYKVRFSCSPPVCSKAVCWTKWYDRDDPSGTGDWEYEINLHNEYPGQICAEPLYIEAVTVIGEIPAILAGNNIYIYSPTKGFVCRNQDQKSGYCKDYKVRFGCPCACPAASPGPSKGAPPCANPVYVQTWTPWYDRDNPSGTGDSETLSDLRKEYPGRICTIPRDVEALTLSGQTVAQAGETIYKYDTTLGFICRNADQSDKWCNDYQVRFSCAPAACEDVCWTTWYDRDDPSGTGDWETQINLQNEYPGQICAEPLYIEAVTVIGEIPAIRTGDNIYIYSPTKGFVCRNQDQKSGYCKDYKVRFGCPCACPAASPGPCKGAAPYINPAYVQAWTTWFDRDNPSGTGDWETLSDLRKEYPGRICTIPRDVEALTLSGQTVAQAGETIYKYDTTLGFICRNADQPDKWCDDYKVRFSCAPAAFEDVCWTKWYDRDNPSGTGDWETQINLQKEYPGQICAEPLYIEAVTVANETPAILTGDNIYIYSPTKGFVCRNQDQKSGYCKDYKVRFGCP